LRDGTPQRRSHTRTRGPNDEALTDEELAYDPDTEAMLEGYSRRIDEVRVEETMDRLTESGGTAFDHQTARMGVNQVATLITWPTART
jgi:hypothetical protein